jgi:hypothetical protein
MTDLRQDLAQGLNAGLESIVNFIETQGLLSAR